ncbi:hypothetical protein AVEN_73359-1 [Araneus ventricosus]|uniref:Uncharacterized protein n=1 Tax=Araneus ventricosus TaxID=182803 RepID=A0A4Y2J134_ARAVE|nr:hypothetical protein AVEN_73359-1 [Araneus ventricosus]
MVWSFEQLNYLMLVDQIKKQLEETPHIEIDEDILPQADEEYKEIKKLIEVNSKEFIESQRPSEDFVPMLSEVQKWES